jgi:hypothetical protein
MIQPEHPRTTQTITDTFSWWLTEEIANSDSGRNAYLSDYGPQRADLFKPIEDPTNYQFQKAKSHHNRINSWVTAYADPKLRQDDDFTAKIIFGCLMNVSGAWRKQCYLESEDMKDYQARRQGAPAGVNIGNFVMQELDPSSTDSYISDEDFDALIRRTRMVKSISLYHHKGAHRVVRGIPSDTEGAITSKNRAPVRNMEAVQRLWLGLAASHVVAAASVRDGDISKVPLLEPRSITDTTGLIYPFIDNPSQRTHAGT